MERQKALEVLKKHTQNKNLVNHALAVEGVMRHFAQKFGHDQDYWGNIGLLHDVDYEKFPTEHLQHTEELLACEGISAEEIKSINSHGYTICCDIEPEHFMEKVLFATDELTGLIVASALVLPTKKIGDVTLESVQKKWKKKEFARGANREIIAKGAEMLEMPLEEMIQITLDGMKVIAPSIGL